MKKQDKTKLVLLLTGFILIVLTYFYYQNLDKIRIPENQNVQKDLKDKLRKEMRKALEKEYIIKEDDRILIYKFINKIKSEINSVGNN